MKANLERVVADLTDATTWSWAYMSSNWDAAQAVLRLMARNGLIEWKTHPMGGDIWRVNGKLYGRTDGITHKKFDALKNSRL